MSTEDLGAMGRLAKALDAKGDTPECRFCLGSTLHTLADLLRQHARDEAKLSKCGKRHVHVCNCGVIAAGEQPSCVSCGEPTSHSSHLPVAKEPLP